MPYDPEEVSINGTSLVQPQWYQFKPRSLMLTPWLAGLGNGVEQPRNRIILADEGGMGKSKAAALLMHHVFSSHPSLPILVLVQPRQLRSWQMEVRSVSRAPTFTHRKWPRRFDPGIHIVSKFAYQHTAQRDDAHEVLDDLWFSLIVLDEAHMHKFNHGGSPSVSSVYAEREKILCENHTERVLGITATPLGLDHNELDELADKLGIPNGARSTQAQWEAWKELNTQTDFLDARFKLATSKVVDYEHWVAFVEKYGARLAATLPLPADVDHMAFVNELRTAAFNGIDGMQALLADLTPTASFMSFMLRSHLGEEAASSLFRTMHVAHPSLVNEFELLVKNIEQTSKENFLTRDEQRRLLANPERYIEKDGLDHVVKLTRNDPQETDPRATWIVNYIRQNLENWRTGLRRGLVVFILEHDGGKTMKYISDQLERAWKNSGGDSPKLQTWQFFGEASSNIEGPPLKERHMQDLRDLRYGSRTRSEEEFHVAICTQIVEAGVNMDWANVLMHWEYPTNPATLLQRNWRLDRHQSDDVLKEFTVVYPQTGLPAERELFEQLRSRARLLDALFEQDHQPCAWPLLADDEWQDCEGGVWKRTYPSEPVVPYLHAASKAACDAWKGPALSQTWMTMRGLSEALNLEMQNENVSAVVRFQAGDRALGYTGLAEGQEIHHLLRIARAHVLEMDEEKEVHLQGPAAVFFDLRGPLVQRLLRRTVAGPIRSTARDGRCLFSIDPQRDDEQPPATTAHLEPHQIAQRWFDTSSHDMAGLHLLQNEQIRPFLEQQGDPFFDELQAVLQRAYVDVGAYELLSGRAVDAYLNTWKTDLKDALQHVHFEFETQIKSLEPNRSRVDRLRKDRLIARYDELGAFIKEFVAARYTATLRYTEVEA